MNNIDEAFNTFQQKQLLSDFVIRWWYQGIELPWILNL